jgi:hypothetical protein
MGRRRRKREKVCSVEEEMRNIALTVPTICPLVLLVKVDV